MIRGLVLAAGLAAALPALAQDRALTPDEIFARADANKDGRVDKAELKATLLPDAKPYVDAVWRARDKNRDGSLSKAELTDNTPPNAIDRPRPRAADTAG